MLTEITPQNQSYLKMLIAYRELFYFFAWRDILVRYKQALLGISWALIRPLLSMAVFALIFGKIANLPSDNINYAVFVLAGMLPWQLFAAAAMDTCNSLVNNPHLILKVYFPRIIIPLSQIIVHLVDFSIAAAMLIILMFFMNVDIGWTILTLPFFILLICFTCAGTGLWLSALTVNYRDFRIIVPYFVQFGMFISPVAYGSFIIAEKWQWLYALNPMVGIIDGFRWAFFGTTHPYFRMTLTISILYAILSTLSGLYYFRKMERFFADKI